MVTLGLDLGDTSIGWAIVDDNTIIDGGVYLYDTPLDMQTDKTLASIRGESRRKRKALKRKNHRLNDLLRICIKYNLISKEATKVNNNTNTPSLFRFREDQSPLRLRSEALDRVLSPKELVRAIYHIAVRRQFDFDTQSDDKDIGIIKKAEENNKNQYLNSGYRTYGEYMYKDIELKGEYTRNKTKRRAPNTLKSEKKMEIKNDAYKYSIHRSYLIDELKQILARQKELGNKYIIDTFVDEILSNITYTKEPPSTLNMVGECTYLAPLKRAPKALYIAQRFTALNNLKNLRLKETNDSGYRALNTNEIVTLLNEGEKKVLKQKDIINILNIDKNTKLKGSDDTVPKDIVNLKSYIELKKLLSGDFDILFDNMNIYDKTIETLTHQKSTTQKIATLTPLLKPLYDDNTENIVQKLKDISYNDHLHLSKEALKRLLPYIESGMRLDEAIIKEGMTITQNPLPLLPPLEETKLSHLPNPVVKRAMSEIRHLVNSILLKYRAIYGEKWAFDTIHIELARELNNKKNKDDIIKKQKKDFENKELAVKFIQENCGSKYITTKNILKVRLWQQQKEECLYSQTKIASNELIDDIVNNNDNFEIDHILPISRSSDDSISNKVLVTKAQNQNKGSQTPYEYFSKIDKWDKFFVYIESDDMKKSLRKEKVSKLLDTTFANREKEFKERNLNDTRVISVYVKDYLQNYLQFSENENIKRRVYAIKGKLTNTLRHQWGLEKKNRENHYHHLQDAIIIAFANSSIIQRLSTYYKSIEDDNTIKIHFDTPYKEFVNDVKDIVDKCNVVRLPKTKTKGSLHKDTIQPKDIYNGSNGLAIRGGIADKDSQYRVDIFQDIKTKKYYSLPYYLSDFNKPMRTEFISRGKIPILLDDKIHSFVCTLFKNDLVEIKTKKDGIVRGYFSYVNPTDGSYIIKSMDNKPNDTYKTTIDKYILNIEINTPIADEKKQEVSKLKKLLKLKCQTDRFIYEEIGKKDIDTKVLNMLDILKSNNYIYSFSNNTSLKIQSNKNDEALLNIHLKEHKKPTLDKNIGINSAQYVKKLKIDRLGDIVEAEYKDRKLLIKKGN